MDGLDGRTKGKMMKKILTLALSLLILAACAPEKDSVVTTNVEKYPFLCEGNQYTFHFEESYFPPYACADSYSYDSKMENQEYRLYGLAMLARDYTRVNKKHVVAITHISGTVKEFE